MIQNSTSAQLSLLEPLAAVRKTKDEDVGDGCWGSEFKNTGTPSRGPVFGSQHLH